MTTKIVVVCEAKADFTIASELADRTACELVDWIEPELLDDLREYVGVDDARNFITWANVKSLAKAAGIQIRGHFDGAPGALDAQATRRALRFVLVSIRDLDAVFLIRDDDNTGQRRKGLEQGRNENAFRDRIVIGVAQCKRECWVLAGFLPQDSVEHKRLQTLREELGMDPTLHAESLSAMHDHDVKSAKRVLGILTDHDWDREVTCWRTTDLAILRQSGRQTGIVEYLDELQTRFVPLLTGK